MADSLPENFGDDLMEGPDLSAHTGKGGGTPLHARVSSNMYAWLFVVGAVVLIWLLGYSFRNVNS